METTTLRPAIEAVLTEAGIEFARNEQNPHLLMVEAMGYKTVFTFDPNDESYVQVGMSFGYRVDPLSERAYLRALHDMGSSYKALKASMNEHGFVLTVEQFWTPESLRVGVSRAVSVLVSGARDLAERVEAIKASSSAQRFVSSMETELAERRKGA